MNKYIISFAAIIKRDDELIGNCQVGYYYNYYPDAKTIYWNACYVNANVFLTKTGFSYDNEFLIPDSSTNIQGEKLIKSILNKVNGASHNYDIKIHTESFLLQSLTNLSKHVYILKDHKNLKQFVSSPAIPLYNSQEENYSDSFQTIANKYLF